MRKLWESCKARITSLLRRPVLRAILLWVIRLVWWFIITHGAGHF